MSRVVLAGLSLAIVFSLFITAQATNAQEDFDYTKAYQDYVFNVDEYRKAEAKYQLERSEYLRHDTLSSKNEAIAATRDFLKARDRVVIAYLTAIRKKLAETDGLGGSEKEPYFAKLDSEVFWHQEHLDRLDTASTLDDLVDDSDEASDQYGITELAAFDALTAVSTAKLNALREPQGELITQVKSKIAEIRQVGDKDTSIVEKWILDSENEAVRNQEKVDAALILVSDIKDRDKSSQKRSRFNSSQAKMGEAHQHIKEANRFLGEIITEIKTAD
jgi:hypothetical protein